ncbi:MAG: DUF3137 domain-containing protein [Parvularculaceae bacterium]
MPITPPSGRKEFEGFAAYFESEIAPYLSAKEDARQNAVMQAGLIVIVAVVIAGALAIYLPAEDMKIKGAAVAAIMGFVVAGWRINRTRADITGGLLQLVCARLGFSYAQKAGRPDFAAVYDRLKLFSGYNREHWEDEVRGAREGAEFTICEAHLKYKSSGKNSSTRTVFHGQLLVIDYHKKFLGETVVRRDAGILNALGKPGAEFQRVGIVSAQFEKAFEAWSTDQVEARDLLDPHVLERFEELERLYEGAKLRAAFSGGKLYVAVETGDRLNMGSMFAPLHGPERVDNILKAFDLIFDLIDVLTKRVGGRIDGAFSVGAVRE